MKKKSKKKVMAILILTAFIIAMFPDVQSDPIDDGKPPPDYGVYNAMEEVQDEKNSRINSPEILSETRNRLDNISIISGEERVDVKSRREVVSPNIPVPKMLGIFEEMKDWDKTYNNDIVDWILPPNGAPLHYYIFSKYNTNTSSVKKWTNASLRRTLLTPEFLHLSNWWGVDVDDDGSDDIEVFFEPGYDGITWEEILNSLIPPREPIELGVTIHYNIRKLDDVPFTAPDFVNLEVYVAKAMSYNDQNFLLFIGYNFTNVVSIFNASVMLETVSLDQLEITLIPPSINFADILNLSGPYHLKWNSANEALDSFSLEIATAKIEFYSSTKYEFLNRGWVDVDFKKTPPYNNVPSSAELIVDADNDLSSFDKIEWRTYDNVVCDAFVKFFDSQENVTYAEIEIDDLPREIDMTMTVEEVNGENISTIDYWARSVVNYLAVHHYEFFDTEYEDITPQSIALGLVEYVHLFVNISHIPVQLYLKGLFYLEEIDDTVQLGLGAGIVEQLINAVASRVISRFTRIAKTLGSIPYRLLSIAEEGSLATVHTYNKGPIDKIEFLFTSGDYVTINNTYENYFAFYNNTRSSQFPIAQISLSGRLSKITYIDSSYETFAFAEIKMMNDEKFRAIYADDINSLNAEMIISNVPGHIIVYKTPINLDYYGDRKVDELRFISDYKNSYMDLRILDMADDISLLYLNNRTHISTGSIQDSIGEIEFLVTTGPIFRMDGNYLLLRQESGYSCLSGRIKDVSMLDYISGDDGKLEVFFAQENCINISLFDNRSEIIRADFVIDPIPRFISVNLSGIFPGGDTGIELPRLDSTGVLGFVSVIFGVASLGNQILAIVDEATHGALDNVGNLIEDLSFSYIATTSTTIIGRIQRGETFTLDDVDWMHGISARQQTASQETAMVAKIYLSGLPRTGGITTRVKGDDMFLDFHLTDYRPEHDWLCVDVRGLQDRDVLLYINDIEEGMDLDLKVNLTARLNIIPQSAFGSIKMNSDENIGSLYGRMRQTEPEISVSEIFLSSIPKSLDTKFNLSGNISIDFQAASGIEHMYVKSTRTRNDEFHDIYAVLHELPEELKISVAPETEYDMDGSLLQNLPSLELSSSGDTLDSYIFADGEGIGQVGTFEVQVVNAAMYLSAEFSGGKYKVDSTGVDYLWIHAMELPVMEDHKTKSIELVGKDIKSFDIDVDMLFGNYPIINIEDSKGGEVQMVIDHEMDGSRAGIALFDFKIKNGLPSSPSILINGGSLDLDSDTSHVIVPAPVLTLFLTVFG